MSDVNGVLGLAGAGEMVESLGEAWTLCHVTPGIRGKFGALVRLRARREVEQLRDSIGVAAYRADLAVFQESCAAGAFSWGCPTDPDGMGSAVSAALRQWEGQAKLIGLLLEPAHGPLPEDRLAEVIAGNRAGFVEALTACLGVGDAAPNGEAPETGRTTTESRTRTTDRPAAV